MATTQVVKLLKRDIDNRTWLFFFCEWVQGIQSYHFAESCQDNLMRLGYISCQLLSKWKLIIMFNLENSDSMTFKSLNHAS